MPTEVDSLINELFPDKRTSAPPPTTKVPSDWDSPPKSVASVKQVSNNTVTASGSRADVAPAASYDQSAPTQTGVLSTAPEPTSSHSATTKAARGIRSSFDEDSDEDTAPASSTSSVPPSYETTSATSALAGLTVPFPVVHEGLCAACHQSFTVTATPNTSLNHPAVSDIRVLHTQLDATTPKAVVMRRKGAFHVSHPDPSVGNGVGEGGCVHMTCRRCDHPVVRLQNAAWADQNGQLDLYLALRNYYPDWSRLATLVAADGSRSPILVSSDSAAAYCCQCSWLTVHGASPVTFPTTAVDIIAFNRAVEKDHRKLHCAFITHVPVAAGTSEESAKRPPLWECKGHDAF
jgi:hypothetical protein